MTTPDATKNHHQQAKKFFEKTAHEKALETKFVQRTSPIDGELFLLTLVLCAYQFGTLDLEQMAKTAQQIDPEVQVTKQAFKERFNPKAVAFLQAMLAEALTLTTPQAPQVVPLLAAFTAVYLLDATTVAWPETLTAEFPGGGGAGPAAALKLYLSLNYLTGAYETMRFEAGRKVDQDMGEKFVAGREPGALWLFDLGFFKAAFLAAIARADSFFPLSAGRFPNRLPLSQRGGGTGAAGFGPVLAVRAARVV